MKHENEHENKHENKHETRVPSGALDEKTQ